VETSSRAAERAVHAIAAERAVMPVTARPYERFWAAWGTFTVSGVSSSYTSVLTASGTGTCALLNGVVTVADFDTGTFYRTCKWVLGNKTCSPAGLTTPI